MSRPREKQPMKTHAAAILAALLVGLPAACGHLPLDREPPESPRAERVRLAEATAMVRASIFAEQPTMNESMVAPLVELTTEEMWQRLGVQLFQVTDGVAECNTYLVFGGGAHLLCGGFGGHGIQSACVTDLDRDGSPELTYTYSWGSGRHRSLIAVARVDGERLLQEEVQLAFAGDLFVRREADSRVGVEIGRYGWEFCQWTPEARLGVIEVQPDGGQLRPRIELAPLSEEHAAALWMQPAARAPREDPTPAEERPNFVIVLTDDQGYADVGCFGAQGFETPHLDRLAAEGMRFTDFHVSQAVCSASRAALLTGCYSERVSIQGALNPGARHGLHPGEETIAEVLREVGYVSGIFGKWHLGHHQPFLPLQQGFDEYFGLPYSNDMWPVDYDGRPFESTARKALYPPLRLVEGNDPGDEVRTLADQARLTERYTERALGFIERNKQRPFFLYLAHSMPHVPLGAPLRFGGRSEQGAYGDVIAEIDDSLGRILGALEEHGLRERTLVVFTSDNGPWLCYGNHAGSAGPLREGKGTSWEGGARVPCIMSWPGRIPVGSVCDRLSATIDLLPTIAALAGAPLPARPIDGVDIVPLLEGRGGASPRRTYYYYYGGHLNGVRRDAWKLVFPHEYRSQRGVEPGADGHPGPYGQGECALELYDLEADPGETTDLAQRHPELVRELQVLGERARAELGDRHREVRGQGVRPPGRLAPRRASPVQHLARGRPVRLDREPSSKYTGGAGPGLVDGVLGSEDFTDGTWLGYEGVDFEAVVDLGQPTGVRRVACSFLRCQISWIFLPRTVELAVSADGTEFEVLARFEQEPEPDFRDETRDFAVGCEPRDVRYVRVRATGLATCPDWHAGAGGKSWIFVDEIAVE